MPRILQLMAGAKRGGAENFFMRLLPALNEAGHHQHAIVRRQNHFRMPLETAGLTVSESRFGGPFDLLTPYKIKSVCKQFKPDICMAWMARATSMLPDSRHAPFINVARLGGYYNLKYFQKCDYLIGNTPDICTYLVTSGWPKERVFYIPNFVDDETLPRLDKREFDTRPDQPVILAMGRLHTNKGFDLAIQSMQEIDDAMLWIAGAGPEEKPLKDLTQKRGLTERVRFLGWREDTAALYATADIFLCSSRHEPFGNIVPEAWANSTPVVALKSQGPMQYMRDGHTGLLVELEDVAGIAKAVNTLLNAPEKAKKIGANGRQAYLENFSKAKVISAYTDFFEKIIQREK